MRPLSLTIFLLLLFGSAASADYRQKAEEQTDYIQTHFYDAAAKRCGPAYSVDPKSLPFDFMWGNGVEFSALVGAARNDPAKDKPLLYEFREGLQTYWDPKAPVPGFNAYCSGPGGTDKYADDNEWLVLGFVDAYETTHDPLFLRDKDRRRGGGVRRPHRLCQRSLLLYPIKGNWMARVSHTALSQCRSGVTDAEIALATTSSNDSVSLIN